MMKETTVHNLHYEKMVEGDVYIGRAGHGKDGYFGNPYNIGDRTTVIAHYREYLRQRMIREPEFRDRILALEGKRLFCFCAPRACHGDVIVEALKLNAQYRGDNMKTEATGASEQ